MGIAAFGLSGVAWPGEDDVEPGIWLEMGVLACARGEREEAERIFRYIERHFEPPAGIKAYIEAQRRAVCPPPWQGSVSLALGYSSNATRGPDLTAYRLGVTVPAEITLAPHQRAQPDYFVEAVGHLDSRLGPGHLSAYANLRHHQNWSLYDEDWIGLHYHIQRHWPPLGRAVMSLGHAWMWLGGQAYAQVLSGEASLQRGPLRYTLQGKQLHYPGASAYDGHILNVYLDYSLNGGNWRLRGRMGGFADDAHAGRPGGDRKGWHSMLYFAYAGQRASVVEASWHHERARSNDVYFPGLIELRRHKRAHRLELAWTLPKYDGEAWRISLVHARGLDSIPFLTYRQTEIVLSWVRPLSW
ncbi:MAG: hypothetical protein RMK60_08040 [Burkholderiales bacterium]|nr:hypothetical protein [Burkholderiales bacterium]